jgi:hypothetical protein
LQKPLLLNFALNSWGTRAHGT